MTIKQSGLSRRSLLATAAGIFISGTTVSLARTLSGGLPWSPGTASPPTPVRPGPWQFLTADEAAVIEAMVDRLIPPDEHGPGGKDAGVAVFIDRQLAGPFGRSGGLYLQPPFMPGTSTQGYQKPETPAGRYRAALKAIADYVGKNFNGQSFTKLSASDQDAILHDLDSGKAKLNGADGAEFMTLLWQNTQEGFFADPIYGGNRDMASWKMIGFPGARYDYRDWIERYNEPYPLPPVSITGRPEWTVKG